MIVELAGHSPYEAAMGILFYDRRKYGDPRGECQAEDNSDLNVLIVTTEGGHWDISVIIYTSMSFFRGSNPTMQRQPCPPYPKHCLHKASARVKSKDERSNSLIFQFLILKFCLYIDNKYCNIREEGK